MAWTWYGWSSHKQDDPAVVIRDKTGPESKAFLARLEADGFRVQTAHSWLMAIKGEVVWTMFNRRMQESSMQNMNKTARVMDRFRDEQAR